MTAAVIPTLLLRRHSHCWIQRRSLSVKELSWCNPKSTTTATATATSARGNACSPGNDNDNDNENTCGISSSNINAPPFGIIAAMDETRVIGINGKLPWSIPQDRDYFLKTTRDKVLIIGKNTFYETNSGSHLKHLRHVIVISTTMKKKKDVHGSSSFSFSSTQSCDFPKVHLVTSFDDALACYLSLAKNKKSCKDSDPDSVQISSASAVSDQNNIDCWIGGGESIYEVALRHPKAKEVRLTTVHSKMNIEQMTQNKDCQISFFPAKYRWDNVFREVSLSKHSNGNGQLSFTCSVFQRKK